MADAYETLRVENDGGVRVISLNRPDVLNACNDRMTADLTDAFKQIERDPGVRCVVLTGAGRAFCSGQDLADLEAKYREGDVPVLGERLRKGYNPLIRRIVELEKPVIAAVNGVAAGAGCSLALACDVRLASEKASLIEVFVNVGLVPDSGSSFFLPRLVGFGKAMEMSITGDKVSAAEALSLGLVSKVVPPDQLMPTALELARRLAAMPTQAIGLTKRLLYGSATRDLPTQLEAEAFAQETAGRTSDHKEGVMAFLEKRKAEFKGC
ncbi:MAG: enoyl-CoA hydratase/isomerase family protein [Phycisphaerales bacterium]|nr:enoyl-CoA hydratase/isomerase family protein [Phycisphaerales bacterium]